MMNQDSDAVNRSRKELSQYSKKSFQRGLISGTGGNLSVRIPGEDVVSDNPQRHLFGRCDSGNKHPCHSGRERS